MNIQKGIDKCEEGMKKSSPLFDTHICFGAIKRVLQAMQEDEEDEKGCPEKDPIIEVYEKYHDGLGRLKSRDPFAFTYELWNAIKQYAKDKGVE